MAVDQPLQKTEYLYKLILPTITDSDMFYNDKILFSDKLTEAEHEAVGNIFQDFKVYAIHTDFQFCYDPKYKKQLSESFAKNALDELKWLKQFAKRRLKNSDVFMIINLWLGKETPYNCVKTECIEVNEWELSEEKSFEFSYGIVYQFTDNSDEAIKRRKKILYK
ncbi:MAG: hypothetical protein ACI4VK_04015 [Candidatus Coproplasma sp.]